MESSKPESMTDAEAHVVPEELMLELHQANEQFHRSKQLVEESMVANEDRHAVRVEQAAEQLRLAERRVEEINQKIHGALKPPPTS